MTPAMPRAGGMNMGRKTQASGKARNDFLKIFPQIFA
jgi:hypothetical protein